MNKRTTRADINMGKIKTLIFNLVDTKYFWNLNNFHQVRSQSKDCKAK